MGPDVSSQRCRIVVTRLLPEPVTRRIAATCESWVNYEDRPMCAQSIGAAAEKIGADVLLVTATDRIDKAVIGRLPDSVRSIATLSVGYEHIDIEAARQRGIAVLRTPDVLNDAVAEMAILLMLGAARRAHEGMRLIYEGRWQGWSPTLLLGRDVTGGRIGIFGMGGIGRTVAQRARGGFDMEVHYHNRRRLPADLEQGAIYHETVQDFLAVSDFLVLCAPSTPQTKGFLNAQNLSRLPAGAIVVNVGRGDLVDDDALVAALKSGAVAAAGLDVFNNEPAIHPAYRELPNVFIQPHLGSSTLGTRTRMGELLLDSVEALRAGEAVANRLV
ncbi:MAG: D-glycerate dehydrogenase [Hyphomicrobiales bacterium]|nr:D-glycerate dehydrogenase [Hyphomicrobiales bacterium]